MTAPATPEPTMVRRTLGDLDNELATTRRVLERVPDAHGDWKPHPKSMSLMEMASHVASLLGWGTAILTSDGMDFAQSPPPSKAGSREELLARFDENAARLRELLAAADDPTLLGTWTGRNGDRVVIALPRIAMMRAMIVNHMIHHRGQLSVYLRLNDVPLPMMYGPTADERMG